MSILSGTRRAQARALAKLAATNPFTDEWTRVEAEALGPAHVRREKPWSHGFDDAARKKNLTALEALTREIADEMRLALARKKGADEDEIGTYREVALFDLYNRCIAPLDDIVHNGSKGRVAYWREFAALFDEAFEVVKPERTAAEVFAGYFQLRRAFHYTFRFLIGTSRVTARLRAAVWQAVFTADAVRYRRALTDRMRDVPTLVLGATGTGKELVARAIGMSGFVPFLEDKGVFAGDPAKGFLPLHLQSLSPTLVESELFGHKKGAFTGALDDRKGRFAQCPPWGAVFLDEVGELDHSLQVKLLRVLETRDFVPVGDSDPQRFPGRVLAATNRDLKAEVARGTFRRDLYFRLAGAVVETPTLRARLDDDDDELARLVAFLAGQLAGEREAPALAADVERVVAKLPKDYPWPGNVRELAQCVRSVLVHGAYEPDSEGGGQSWLDEARMGELSVEDLVTAYVKHVHARIGTYDGTAKKIGLDRRTVRARVEGA